MKIVIAPDKFKGSLTAKEVADSIEEGIRSCHKRDCTIIKLPVADGGDGTAETLVDAMSGSWIPADAHDPLNRTIHARYGIICEDTAVLDIATASGLSLLKPNELSPLLATTIGTGELIRAAIRQGFRKFVIGAGGSATNDAATGILSALGYRFLNASGTPVFPCGKNLDQIAVIDDQYALPELKHCDFTILCDVDTRFFGEKGAAYQFAAQKGADKETVRKLDYGLHCFAKILENKTHKNVQDMAFAGVAGAAGGTLKAILNANLTQGINKILEITDFHQIAKNADLVITGEGTMDQTTLLGKTPYGVCKASALLKIPTISFAGKVKDRAILEAAGFKGIYQIQPSDDPNEDIMNPSVAYRNLKQTASRIFQTMPQYLLIP